MELKLKLLKLKISDYLLLAWVFLLTLMLVNSGSNFVLKQFESEMLGSLYSILFTQICFLIYAVAVNIYFKLELFKARLKFLDLLKKAFLYFFISLALVFATNLIINAIAYLLGYTFNLQAAIELWLNIDARLELFLGLITTVILAPLVEELLFRGLLYRLFRSVMPAYLSIILTSIAFASVHFSAFAFIALFFISALLCYLYEKFADLRLCILIHTLFNLFNIILICQFGQSA